MKKYVFGGEYYFTLSDIFRKKQFDINGYLQEKYPTKHFLFTGGGYSSLNVIINDIRFLTDEEILMPSYLCPTILKAFDLKKIKYSFYKVDFRLKIDIEDLISKVTKNTKAIFIINYFGFTYQDIIKIKLQELKDNGLIIIEDIVQSFFSNHKLLGNYAFNSFRKYLPVDGSVIISDKKIECNFNVFFSKYNFYKTVGQVLRYFSSKVWFIDFSRFFLYFFNKANQHYYESELVGMNKFGKYLLSKQRIEKMVASRRKLFLAIITDLRDSALFTDLEINDVPLGIPIVVKERDVLRKNLMAYNIYCPVHWKIEHLIKDEFLDSVMLSESILTIPLSFKLDELSEFLKRLRIAGKGLSY